MSRVLKRLAGSGTAGAFASGDKFKFTPHISPLKDDVDLFLLGVIGRNQYAGGTLASPITLDGTGVIDLEPALPLELDNQNNQLSAFSDSNGGVLKVRFRFSVRVSDGSITVTPRIYNVTTSAAATIAGEAACSATDEDYSGTNQQQEITLTLPNAKNVFKPQLTVGGTVGSGDLVWGLAMFDLFVET